MTGNQKKKAEQLDKNKIRKYKNIPIKDFFLWFFFSCYHYDLEQNPSWFLAESRFKNS